MNKDKIIKIIKHKAEELNLDANVKIDEHKNIGIDIINIRQSAGYVHIHTDTLDGLFLMSMQYSHESNGEAIKYERILRNKDIDEIVTILCVILKTYNYRGIYISRNSLIEEFKKNEKFNKYFHLSDKDDSISSNIDYNENIENILSIFKDFVYNLMLVDKVCDHILFRETEDKKNQSFVLIFDKNK